jgi:parallel beta-helix repeat protein
LFTAASLLAAATAASAPWPGGTEISIPILDAETNLSGATWNPQSQSLWVVRQNKQVWEYQYDGATSSFELAQMLFLPAEVGGDIEACAQVDRSIADELYSLSEDAGRLARVVNLDGTPSVHRVWNLEVTNNGHALPPETSGAGAEGLEFVPDADLLAAGFRFPDGSAFTGSTRGMGGLIFVGHQVAGRLHVFDVNPDVSEDFVNHGSFQTASPEIAGLHYDRTSARMYLWHDPSGSKSLEVSTLSSDTSVGTIDVLELYDSGMPSGNLEGIALVSRASCGEFGVLDSDRVLFMTRDGGSPNLVYFAEHPCDCTGAENEAEFDVCAVSGDLSGGCICLDQDLDSDVDCDDYDPPIASQCVEPIAFDDAYVVPNSATLVVDAPGVLANDVSVLNAELVSGASSGDLSLQDDGSFTYTHDGSAASADSFRYRADNGTVESNEATAHVAVVAAPGATLEVPAQYASIQAAHDAASSGDVILVAPGTYTGSLTLTKAVTLASRFLTTGDESYIETTILDGGGGAHVIEIPATAEDRPTITGFTIQNADDGIFPSAKFDLLRNRIRWTTDGVDYEDGSGGLCLFNVFELNDDDGIDLDDAVDIVIEYNTIRNNDDDGIEIRLQDYSGPTLDIAIRYNAIYGNGEDGIQLIDYGGLTDRYFDIRYNAIHDNVQAGLGLMGGERTVETYEAWSIPEPIDVIGNTFENNNHGMTGGDNALLLNNLFVGHPVLALKNVDGSSVAAFNLFYDNGTDQVGRFASPIDGGESGDRRRYRRLQLPGSAGAGPGSVGVPGRRSRSRRLRIRERLSGGRRGRGRIPLRGGLRRRRRPGEPGGVRAVRWRRQRLRQRGGRAGRDRRGDLVPRWRWRRLWRRG